MRCAVISSSDLFGPENEGRMISAKFGIMLATFLSPDMDVNSRIESLEHYLREDRWSAVKKAQYNSIWEQPTVSLAVQKLCKHFGITCTPRIETNLREAVKALGKVRKEEIRREIEQLQQKMEHMLRAEK